jgi:hypothetical protein
MLLVLKTLDYWTSDLLSNGYKKISLPLAATLQKLLSWERGQLIDTTTQATC